MHSTESLTKDELKQISKKLKKSEAFVNEFAGDKRNCPRDSHNQPVRIYLCNSDGQVQDYGFAEVIDISAGGLKIHGLKLSKNSVPDEDSRLLLEVVPGNSILLEVKTKVCWFDEKTQSYGLEFEEVRRQVL